MRRPWNYESLSNSPNIGNMEFIHTFEPCHLLLNPFKSALNFFVCCCSSAEILLPFHPLARAKSHAVKIWTFFYVHPLNVIQRVMKMLSILLRYWKYAKRNEKNYKTSLVPVYSLRFIHLFISILNQFQENARLQLRHNSIVATSTFTQIRARVYVYGNCDMLCACAELEH